MARRVGGRREKILDAGAYHGLYTLVMAQAAGAGSEVVAVDPVASNRALIEVNLALNGLEARIEACAVSTRDARVQLSSGSCGHIVDQGGVDTASRRLPSILPDATVVKVDIEGEEFAILPEQLDEMPAAHTWNVEIHPGRGRDPQPLIEAFAERGFELHWVNRDACRVEPYSLATPWTTRTSLIAVRP